MELNHYSDMSDEEISAKLLIRQMNAEEIAEYNSLPKAGIPTGVSMLNQVAVVDWRKSNIIPPILNQGTCGSCWAFAAASVAEAEFNRKNRGLLQFSPQQMLDCSGGGNC